MILLSRYHRENYIRVVVLAFVIIAPSLLMAEDRPGFYSPYFRSFELTKYNVSFNSSVSNTISENNSTGLRCIGSECTTTQNTYSNDRDQYSFDVSFITPHVDRLSFGSFVKYTDQSTSISQETSDGLNTNYDSNYAASLRVTGSYLLSDVSTVSASISQDRSTSANQTQRNVSFEAASRFADNVMLTGFISALWGDELLPNGIKDTSVSLRYSDSLGSIEATGYLGIHSATRIRRSSVAGQATATEEKFNGFGSGGAVYFKRDESRFGLTASLDGNNFDGSPRNYSIGPRYIFTGSKFEFTFSGNYRVSRSNNIVLSSGETDYLDNVTKELRLGYVRDFSEGYYLNTSIVRSWNSGGSRLIGTQAEYQNSSDTWSSNLNLVKEF